MHKQQYSGDPLASFADCRWTNTTRRARFRACGCRRLSNLHVVNDDEYPVCDCVLH